MGKYNKELLENVAKDCKSFADVARKLGLSPFGGTQHHLKKRFIDFGVDFSHFKINKRIKYTKELLEDLAKKCNSFAEVAKHLSLSPFSGSQTHLKKKFAIFEINYDHFEYHPWNKGKILKEFRRKPQDILILRRNGSNREHSHLLRRALLEIGVEEKCAICGLNKIWNEQELNFEIDHVDGNYLNNIKDNLRFLCPNCHSQTKNYKNKNRKRSEVGEEPVLKTDAP